MTDYPRDPSLDQQVRTLQEQVRRLWTRLPLVEPVEPWQSLAPHLNANYATSGTLGTDFGHARFYKDRERVYFAGLVEAQSDGQGIVVASMPAGYRPPLMINQQLPVDPENSPSSTAEKIWTVEILTTGEFSLDQHSAFAGGTTLGYPPALTDFYLDGVSYRVT